MASLNDVRVAGWIGPFGDTDTYYCTDPIYGIDGSRSVPDKATRNAITTQRRRQGMFVVIQADFGLGINTVWQLNPPPWNNDDTDWTQFIGAGAITTVGGDLSGSLPNPTVVSTNGVLFGSMAVQNASAVGITGGTITGLPIPVNGSDAVTKAYTDALTFGFTEHTTVRVATTTALNATYNNGTAGVGATLTMVAPGALSIDGVSLSGGQRVLVNNQVAGAQNGIYVVTVIGDGSNNAVLTRATEFDQAIAGEVATGAYVVVGEGTVNAGTLWVETGVGPFVVGTTSISFTQLKVPPLTVTFTGDISGTGFGTIATTTVGLNGHPLGSTIPVGGHLLIASGTQWVSVAVSGDGTISSSGQLIVTKTNGVLFAPSATIDTTDATNITSGIISTARLGSGTANSTTFLRGDRTWQSIVQAAAGSNMQIQYNAVGVLGASGNFIWNYTTNTLHIDLGTATSAKSALNIVGAFNNAAVTFPAALVVNITNTASQSNSLLLDLQSGVAGGISVFKVDVNGDVIAGGIFTGSGAGLTNLNAANLTGTVNPARLGSGTANSTTFLRGDNTWQVISLGGGLVSVPTTAARDAYPNSLRVEGMIIYIEAADLTNPNTYWTLLPAPWAGTSADWAPAGPLSVQHGGTTVASRGVLNLIDGSGVTLTVVDNPTNDRVDITVTATGGGGGGGGSALPAGVDTQVQFNQGGVFGAKGNLTFNYTNNTLTATNLAGSGAGLTNLNASNISSGIVPTAHLGSGTADSTTFLRGDNTWQTITTNLIGGLVSVSTTAARDTYPDSLRVEGMIIYIETGDLTNPNTYWTLLPAPWAGTSADWAPAGPLSVQHGGTTVASRGVLNLIDGSGVTLTVVDNPTNDRVDITVAATGGGTVTSVSMTVPSWLSVSVPEIVDAGTFAITAATGQSANQFLATPNGSTGAISLRALVTADLPTGIPNTKLQNSSVTISGHSLSLGGSLSLVTADVGLSNVTNDIQTKAAIVPNTVPSPAQILVGNAGGTAYAPVTMSGDGTLTASGHLTVTTTNGALLGTMAVQNANAVAISGGSITGMPLPVGGSDVATKLYVDGLVTSIQPRDAVRVATTTALTATYSNGTSGVGATLTNAGTQVALTVDGVDLSVSDRVLVKNQAATAQNGIYSVTSIGSGSTNWVLTRATDYDQSSEIIEGTYTIVSVGTTNAGSIWVETSLGPFTVGTTAITWIQLQIAPIAVSLTGDVSGSGTNTVATSVVAINGAALGSTTPTSGNILIGSGTSWVTHIVSGDVTLSSTGAITIAPNVVTYSKIQNVSVFSLLGNPSGVIGAPSEIILGSGLYFSGNTLVSIGTGGTVTSVGLDLPGIFDVTVPSVNSSGTLTATLVTQSANLVWAGPSSGLASTPIFRSLVIADLPTGIPNVKLANSAVTISGHSLSLGGSLSLVTADVGLSNVTNDIQTKAAIVPNTIPSPAQILVGNAGGTAYAPVTVSGDGTLTASGHLTVTTTNGALLGTMAVQNANAVAISGGSITGMPLPVGGSDVATKLYVDGLVTNIQPRNAVRVATTTALTVTYSNGTSGVGATLTNAGTQVALTVDGVVLSVSDRVLVKNQAATAQNGIYSVTSIGSGSTNWVLTRAIDYDQPSEITEGTYTIVSVGTANAGSVWIETNLGPFTVGTTAITWIQLQIAPIAVSLTGDVSGSGTNTVVTSVVAINGAALGSTTPASGNLLIGSGTSWVTHGVSGDITLSSTGVATIASHGVTYAKIQNVAIFSLLGNPTGSSASPSEITLGPGLSFSGTTLVSTGTGGTVTSVGLDLPGIFDVTGSPVTGSDILTATLVDQLANLVWAGPSSGGASTPIFRSLVIADLPTGIPNVKLANSAVTISGHSLPLGGSLSLVPADVGISIPISVANGGTGLTNVSLGQMFYGGNTNTIQTLGGNATTTKKFLTQLGTGSFPGTPAWSTISTSDLGTGSASSSTYLRGDGTWAAITPTSLVPTGVKTTAYTASPLDFVPVDAGSASVTVTLPTTPSDKTLIGVKLINVSGANTATVAAGGSDLFNKSGGPATLVLSVTNESVYLEYSSSAALWYTVAGDNRPGGYAPGSGVSITTSGGSRTIAVSGAALTAAANTFTHGQIITAASGEVGLAITAAINADALDIKDSTGILRTAFDKDGFGFPYTYSFALGAGTSITIGNDKTVWVSVIRNCKLIKVFTAIKTPSVGASIIVDILRCPVGSSPGTSTNWVSIFSGGNNNTVTTPDHRPTVPAGSYTATFTSFDVGSSAGAVNLSEGDLLRIDIAQVGSSVAGQDMSVQLLALHRNQ